MTEKTWIRLLVGGITMLCISSVVFGGLVHTFITDPTSWKFKMFLAFSGASTLVTGVLMVFDSMKYKIREEIQRAIRKKSDSYNVNAKIEKRDIEHMNELADEVERLRPREFESQS